MTTVPKKSLPPEVSSAGYTSESGRRALEAFWEDARRNSTNIGQPLTTSTPIEEIQMISRADSEYILNDAQYRQLSSERDAKASAYSAAEVVMEALNDSQPPEPMPSESSINYRRRLAAGLQKYSREWGKVDLKLCAPDTFQRIEQAIYTDAAREAREPTSLTIRPGEVVERFTRDGTGRITRRFFGDPRAVWGQFTNGGYTGRFVRPK